MKKLIIVTMVFLGGLMLSGFAQATVYSCEEGRLKIGALQTNLRQATVCVGNSSITYTCNGGTGMTAYVATYDTVCATNKMEFPKIELTKANLGHELSNLFSVNYSKCVGSKCRVSLNGFDIAPTVAEKFSGFDSMSEDSDGSGVSFLVFKFSGKDVRVTGEEGCTPFPECKLY